MSMTSTISNQATAEWVRLFPKTVTSSYTNSVTFMKQLTVIAVSTVLYLKDIVPRESFKVESFGGLKLRILKQRCNDQIAQFVSTSLIQALEAFDKEYLYQLALCFYNGEHRADNLIEYHIFEYTYNPAGVTIDVHSKTIDSSMTSSRYTFENIREKTINLINTCVLMGQTLNKLNVSVDDISLRLYYNDNAPEDYQAPGYFPTPDSEDHLVNIDDTVKPGSVRTPYHRLKMYSFVKDLVPDIKEAIVQKSTSKTSHDSLSNDTRSDAEKSGNSDVEKGQRVLRCICNIQDTVSFDPQTFIMCNYCTTYQHAICYGIRPSDTSRYSRDTHCCATCHDINPSRKLNDEILTTYGAKQRESLAILRRALYCCSRVDAISVSDLVDMIPMSTIGAAKLMKGLYNFGIVDRIESSSTADLTTPRKIIREKLKEVIDKYYQTEKEDIYERLLAESLPKEELDPVGDKLESSEKINLRNATTITVVAQVHEPKNIAEDATLKQYREAVFLDPNNGHKLPLSGTHNPIQDIEDLGKKDAKRKSSSDRKTGFKAKKLKTTRK